MQKTKPMRSEDYRRLVASLPCAICGIEGYSQAAHADEGKGMGTKSDDSTCYPACSDRPGIVGCHTTMGATGKLGKEQRRETEKTLAMRTRAKIRRMGLSDRKVQSIVEKTIGT